MRALLVATSAARASRSSGETLRGSGGLHNRASVGGNSIAGSESARVLRLGLGAVILGNGTGAGEWFSSGALSALGVALASGEEALAARAALLSSRVGGERASGAGSAFGGVLRGHLGGIVSSWFTRCAVSIVVDVLASWASLGESSDEREGREGDDGEL